MKAILLFAILALMLFPVVASAQVNPYIRVDDYPMGSAGRVYPSATAAGDTIIFGLAYNGTSSYITPGQQPDSIRYGVFGVSDSMGMDIDYFFSPGPSLFWKSPAIDSLTTLGTKGAYKNVLIARSTWQGYDMMKIAVLSRALGAVGRAKTPTRAWVRVERYFKITRQP